VAGRLHGFWDRPVYARLSTNKHGWELVGEWERSENAVYQRFGQWVYNTYVKDNKPWPDLFYAVGIGQALSLIEHDREAKQMLLG
jgi:hypothetical protein